jgi:hypothetical protein
VDIYSCMLRGNMEQLRSLKQTRLSQQILKLLDHLLNQWRTNNCIGVPPNDV